MSDDEAPYWFKPFAEAVGAYRGVKNVRFMRLTEEGGDLIPGLPADFYEAYCFFECRNRRTLWSLSKILSELPVNTKTGHVEYESLEITVSPFEEEHEDGSMTLDIEFCIHFYPNEEDCELNIPQITKRILNSQREYGF